MGKKILFQTLNQTRNTANQEIELAPTETAIFDDLLYKHISVIEHSNAWIDGFKALLVRFEFSRGRQKLDGSAFYGILSHFLKKNQQKKTKFKQLHYMIVNYEAV